MTYRVTFKNGDTRRGLSFDLAMSLFMTYRLTTNLHTLR